MSALDRAIHHSNRATERAERKGCARAAHVRAMIADQV
jgi:hypothetical protein